jgi:cobalamin synthase
VSSAPRDNGVSRSVGRFASLTGLSVGALSGCVYWLAVQLWPSSVALMLSILAGTLLSNEMRQAASANRMEMLGQVFYVLIKYNVLMALSAANLPFAAPPNTPLCLIMICGYGASRSLSVWMSSRSAPPAAPAQAAPMQAAPMQAAPLSHLELALTLLLGFAPAMLLGLPGLVGLAAAVLSVIAVMRARAGAPLATWITELTFYLGAQASWSYA